MSAEEYPRVLVTGASRGLGRKTALGLASNGWKVTACARPSSELESLGRLLSVQAGNVVGCDLTQETGVEELISATGLGFEAVVHALGGTLSVRDPLFSAKELQEVVAHNLSVAIELNRRLVPVMSTKEGGQGGTLIHISSLASVVNLGSPSYSIAKSMLNAYVRNLDNSFRSQGIKVFNILPSRIALERGQETKHVEVTAEAVFDLIDFLLSERAAIVSGSTFFADANSAKMVGQGMFES